MTEGGAKPRAPGPGAGQPHAAAAGDLPAVTEDRQGPMSPNRRAWARFRRNRPAFASLLFLTAFLLVVVFWPAGDANKLTELQFAGPSAGHWCGTDVHGRDLFLRLITGARLSLLVGVVGAGVSLLIGVSWGAVAGYAGGRIDGAMMRIVDILYCLPNIIFVIVLITTLEGVLKDWLAAGNLGVSARLLLLFMGLGAISWLTMARIVRGQVMSLKQRPFVEASRVLGASHTRLVMRHILPNTAGVVIVYLMLTVPSVILYESFLSFLGLGMQAPMASWGSLIAEGAAQLNPIRIYWWLIVFPGATMVSALLALNFLGDGLRDALDPRDQR